MNKSTSWMMLAAAAWGVSGCTTTDPADATDSVTYGTPNVHVVFENPEKFTDAGSRLGDRADPKNLDPLGKFLVREASNRLAPGQRMTVVFYDVDLAGDFEPGGISPTGDVRVMREIYAPRLLFVYVIVDQTDTVVEEGNVTLSNRDFLRELRLPHTQQDPLHHEKAMLRDWVRKTLPAQSEG
jgi:hypothetical protein